MLCRILFCEWKRWTRLHRWLPECSLSSLRIGAGVVIALLIAYCAYYAYYVELERREQAYSELNLVLSGLQFEATLNSTLSQSLREVILPEKTKDRIVAEFGPLWLKRQLNTRLSTKYSAEEVKKIGIELTFLQASVGRHRKFNPGSFSPLLNSQRQCQEIQKTRPRFWQAHQKSTFWSTFLTQTKALMSESLRTVLLSQGLKNGRIRATPFENQVSEQLTCISAILSEDLSEEQLSRVHTIATLPQVPEFLKTVLTEFRIVLAESQAAL